MFVEIPTNILKLKTLKNLNGLNLPKKVIVSFMKKCHFQTFINFMVNLLCHGMIFKLSLYDLSKKVYLITITLFL